VIERDGSQIRVSGPLTVSTVAQLCEAGRQEFTGGGEVVVDLSGTTDVDSAALSLLFEWRREAQRHNTHMSVRNLPASLQSLATLYGVADLVATSG
jgi:phospholipid transport system transporter-binding protein